MRAPHPDAELLAACEAFDALERRMHGLFEGPTMIRDDDERINAIQGIEAEQEPYLDLILAGRAHTMDGILAKVRTVLLEDLEILSPNIDESGYVNMRLMFTLMRDLAELAGAAPGAVGAPDEDVFATGVGLRLGNDTAASLATDLMAGIKPAR